MKSKIQILFFILMLGLMMIPQHLIHAGSSETSSVTQEIKKGSQTFNPEEVGSRMEQKGTELFGMVRSGSKLYISVALIVFFLLLFGGMIFKKLLTWAFIFLFVAILGFLILNYWPQIIDVVLAIISWFFEGELRVKLHLVFEPSILTTLVQALHTQGYSVSGTDVTLEQFAIAANAKQIDADVAIVDGSLGVLRKQESVGWLKEVRMRIPDMRIIVVLPETDLDWQRSLGMYGIYDVYLAEQFRLEDVQYWIQTKKTLADVPQFHATVAGNKAEHKVGFSLEKNKVKIQAILADWTNGFKRADRRSGPTVETTPTSEEERLAEEQGTEELEAPSGPLEVQEAMVERTEHQPEQTPVLHIPQPYIVAVGGLASRSGNTHTAIQIAYEIASQGIKTAFIEYRSKPKPSDIVSFATDFDGLQFHHQGIDFFQIEAQWM